MTAAILVILTSAGITAGAVTVHVRGLRRPESRSFYRMMERSYDNPESLWAAPIPKRRRFR